MADQNVRNKTADSIAGILEHVPNQHERALLQRRARRLAAMEQQIRKATQNLRDIGAGSDSGITRVRDEFVFRRDPAPGDPSDRRLPARQERPPATRLISPRGSALKLILIALFEAQARFRPGSQPDNGRPLDGVGGEVGWTDLLATDAKPGGAGKSYMSVSAKKGRHLREALRTLNDEELVQFPHANDARNKHRNFVLAREGGRRVEGENPRYRVPRPTEHCFELPAGLFTNGWIYVLEDRELAYLLMLAYFHRSEPAGTRIPSWVRLLHMGIGRETMATHGLFGALGIANVTAAPDRRADGTIEDYGSDSGALPDLIQFIPDGLHQDAYGAVTGEIDRLIGLTR